MQNRKRHIYFFLFFIFCLWNNLSAQYINWVDTTYDRHEITLNYLKTSTGYISCGTTYYNSDSPSNFRNLEVKTYDENLNVLTIDRYGDTLSLYQPYALTKLGNYYYAGGFKINDTAIIGTINKIDANGNILSEISFLTNYVDVRIANLIAKDNFLYVGGNLVDNSDPYVFVLKIDTLGNIIWREDFNQGINDYILSLDTTIDNKLTLTTACQLNGFNTKTYFYKIDTSGVIKWTKILGGNQDKYILLCKQLPNSSYFCYGAKENAFNIFDSWFLKLDSLGNVLLDTTLSFVTNNDGANYGSIINDGIFITGNTEVGGGELSYLLKFDFNGQLIWQRNFAERTLGNYLYSHIDLQNGFHFFGGWVSSDSGNNTNDEWFLVLDEFGCDVSNCNLALNESESINNFIVYPNPTTQNFTIQLPFENNAIITIYNSIGELTYTTLTSNSKIDISTQDFENGIYFVNVNSDNFFQSQKLIIAK